MRSAGIVAQSYAPGVSVSAVPRRCDVNANPIFTWRRDARYKPGSGADDALQRGNQLETLSQIAAPQVRANQVVTMLGALRRRLCVDVAGLNNPVVQWRTSGGRLHRQRHRIPLLPR